MKKQSSKRITKQKKFFHLKIHCFDDNSNEWKKKYLNEPDHNEGW